MPKDPKDKLTHKQQILLFQHWESLSKAEKEKLTNEKRALLLGNLLNRDEKNTSDYLRYFGGKKADRKFVCKTPENIEKVNALLKTIGMKEITI